jgi:hypothetical protein
MTMTAMLFLAGLLLQAATAPTIMPADDQIASAILAAPEDRRAGATVLGYDQSGKLVTLRKGTNDLVCLADNPNDKTFSVACYHSDLEPFMARGRELLAQGVKDPAERDKMRWKEIEEKKLAMSREARTLYVLTGSGFDAATGKVGNAYLRWVLYTPFATPQTTGLSTKPIDNAPWLMDEGTAGAHIMISPSRPEK